MGQLLPGEKDISRVSTQIHTRWLDRRVAHQNMKKQGKKHVNKHDYYGPMWETTRVNSYFADHWRDNVTSVATIDRRKVK